MNLSNLIITTESINGYWVFISGDDDGFSITEILLNDVIVVVNSGDVICEGVGCNVDFIRSGIYTFQYCVGSCGTVDCATGIIQVVDPDRVSITFTVYEENGNLYLSFTENGYCNSITTVTWTYPPEDGRVTIGTIENPVLLGNIVDNVFTDVYGVYTLSFTCDGCVVGPFEYNHLAP